MYKIDRRGGGSKNRSLGQTLDLELRVKLNSLRHASISFYKSLEMPAVRQCSLQYRLENNLKI